MHKRLWIAGLVAALVLVTVALFVPPVRAWLGDWFRSHNDAGDWIAFAAAVVAALGWWQARVSAASAAVSANAANRSADVAEAVLHREEAPQWEVQFERVELGICVVVATLASGPFAIDVRPFYSGLIRGQPSAEGTSTPIALVGKRLDSCTGLHMGGHIRFPVDVPDGIGMPSYIELTIVLPSTVSDVGPGARSWDYAETKHWRPDPVQPFFAGFG